MKCITLTEPYATLFANGLKKNETRSWRTFHIGDLAIHAAKNFPQWARDLCSEEPFRSALEGLGIMSWRAFDLGAIIGKTTLVKCHQIPPQHMLMTGLQGSLVLPPPEPELSFGDYTPGRWAWETVNPMPFLNHIKWRGQLSLYDVDIVPSYPRRTVGR